MVNQRVYVDHAATTAIRPEAVQAFVAATDAVGNPSSQHTSGRRIRGIFDDAVAEIAELLGVPPSWVILTSGGTESDNMVLRGVTGRVVGCSTDHPAIVDTVRALGGDLAPVTPAGLIDPDALDDLLASKGERDAAALVSVALVNNETGVVQDLDQVADIAARHGALVHTDAVQSVGHVPFPDFARIPLASYTGHKFGAPVGIGILVADPAVTLNPSGTGGGQQRGLRSGTLDAAGAAALAAALRATVEEGATEHQRRSELAKKLRRGILSVDPTAVLTAEGTPHSPHITHVCFPGADQDAVLFMLDQRGIDCSAGSACQAGVTQASHVLAAMGFSDELMRGAVRFSLGYSSTDQDVDRVLEELPEALDTARKVGSGTRQG